MLQYYNLNTVYKYTKTVIILQNSCSYNIWNSQIEVHVYVKFIKGIISELIIHIQTSFIILHKIEPSSYISLHDITIVLYGKT